MGNLHNGPPALNTAVITSQGDGGDSGGDDDDDLPIIATCAFTYLLTAPYVLKTLREMSLFTNLLLELDMWREGILSYSPLLLANSNFN